MWRIVIPTNVADGIGIGLIIGLTIAIISIACLHEKWRRAYNSLLEKFYELRRENRKLKGEDESKE